MMAKRRFFRGGYSGIFPLVVTFLLVSNCLLAAEQVGASEGTGYKIFSLKHISVEQGKDYLAKVMIGTVTHFPGSSALLVTAEPRELDKAKAILDLVDGSEQFVVTEILPISAARNMPSNKQIAAKLGDVSIGDFSNPPPGDMSTKVIIDIHDGSVVAVAPVRLLERIVTAIGQLQNSSELKAQDKQEAPAEQKTPEPTEPNEPGSRFAAKDKMKALPNSIAGVLEQRVSRQEALDQETPKPADVVGPYEPESIANGDEIVNLRLTDFEKLTIIEFLGLVGPYLQLDFMYDPKLLVGEVTLNPHGKFRGPIKIKDLYPLLESVLKFKGFAMTRGKGNLVTIVPATNALEIDPALLEFDKVKIERGDGIVTRVFKLEHVDTTSAQNLLTGMKLTTSITPITETKTLIVTGYAYRMPRIEALLKIVDKPGEPKKFRFRQLQYTMARTLAPKVQTLAEQLGTISITVAETQELISPTISPQRPGETDVQYRQRVRQAEARARQRAGARVPAPAQQPAPVGPTVYLDFDERTNRILMIGLDEQLDDVEKLITTLDVAQQDLRTLQLYKIEHVDAEDVKKKLGELGIIGAIETTTSMRITDSARTTAPQTTRPTTAARRAARTQADRETTEALVEEPQVIVVEPTNSLLVNATAEQHTKIAQILSYVDRQTDEEENPYQLYPLENQSPLHLTEVLEKLIQETIQDKEGKIETVVRKQDEQIIIVPDPNTFSLIVYASKKNQEWLAGLIEKLDKRRPQVLIDVTLVLVSKTDAFEYDLDIIQSFPDLTDTSGLTSAIMPIGEPLDGGTFNLVKTLTDSDRSRFIDWQAKSGNGTFFYGDEHINVLLTAMQQKDYGRILAKPKILVNDNEPGMIQVLDRTYVTKQTGTVVEGVSPVVQTGVEYQDYEAGITLNITPHISLADLLRLDITLNQSDFGTITGEKPPDTTEADIETTVTIPDGSTIILGGLVKLNQSKGGTKVPLLGDIPLLGGLFRSTSSSDLQRNMYVFVKAEIIRPADTGLAQADLAKISDANRRSFEEHEAEFQKYQDWPGVTPKTMRPLKVLDAQ